MMKPSIAAAAATACLVVGAVATNLAQAATTTHPITLCVNKVSRVVTKPAAGKHCNALRQVSISIASGQDAAHLARALDSAQSATTQLRSMFTGQLELTLAPDTTTQFDAEVTGQLLKPGAAVELHYTDSKQSAQVIQLGHADQTGHFTISMTGLACPGIDMFASSTDLNAAPVHSVTYPSAPGCP